MLLPEIRAAKTTPMRHCLFEGPLGVGKTELANSVAHELGAAVVHSPDARTLTPRVVNEMLLALSYKAIKSGEYTRDGQPTALSKPLVLIVDEVHNLPSF